MRYLYITGINPEPWTAPDVAVGRSGGKAFPIVHKKARLRAYQEAISESVRDAYPDIEMWGAGQHIRARFLFWRQLDSYTTASGKAGKRNEADATNLQKALEDALQGILFFNDRDIKTIESVIVDEGPEVQPTIVVMLDRFPEPRLHQFETIRQTLASEERPRIPGNVFLLDGLL